MSYKSSSTSFSFGQNDDIAVTKKSPKESKAKNSPSQKRAESCSNNSVVDKVGTKKGNCIGLKKRYTFRTENQLNYSIFDKMTGQK